MTEAKIISGWPGRVFLYMCPVPPLEKIAVRVLHHPTRKVWSKRTTFGKRCAMCSPSCGCINLWLSPTNKTAASI